MQDLSLEKPALSDVIHGVGRPVSARLGQSNLGRSMRSYDQGALPGGALKACTTWVTSTNSKTFNFRFENEQQHGGLPVVLRTVGAYEDFKNITFLFVASPDAG